MSLGRFFGGLWLPGLKPAPAAVRRLPMPARLRVPLLQHAGAEAEPCVAVGDRVHRFQLIGRAPSGVLGAMVHSPAAGMVVALERGPVALPDTPEALHVVIDVDADSAGDADSDARLPPLNPQTAPIDLLRERIAEAGVVGLGGAGYPSADKLAVGRQLLILNGAECEPVVASDEALLREQADDVLQAGRLLARLSGATRIVLAMEERMASALPAVREALGRDAARAAMDANELVAQIELALLPDRYPAGGERQLIQVITGDAVPADGIPRDLGILVQNVATAVAALRAVRDGEPLVSRYVTVGGDGVDAAAVFEVAIGTPVSALAEAVGGWREDARVLRAGGPMMGTPLPNDTVAVIKTTIALTAWREGTAAKPEPLPCIRCGDCASACPARLQPQLLHARLQADDQSGAEAMGLAACIECGACDAVCPSAIPLTQGFRRARAERRMAAHSRIAADAAKDRFEQRAERLQRDAETAAEAQAERVRQAPSAAAAALAKVRARKAAAAEASTDATNSPQAPDEPRS